MRQYVAPTMTLMTVGVQHPVLGLVIGDGAPIVTSGSIVYPGPGGEFDPGDEVAVKPYSVWDDDWNKAP